MKKIFEFAVLTAETVPGYTVRELENVEFAACQGYFSTSYEKAKHALVCKVAHDYNSRVAHDFSGWSKVNAILGFKLVSHYDGSHPMLIAYGSPAYIEKDPGSKTSVRFVNYEVDI